VGNYVDSNLIAGEQVIYEAKNHWVTFISWRSLLTLGLLPYIDLKTNEYVITNKRVMIKIGLVSRKTLEMNLSKVESISVNQGIIGRILSYGDMTVVGSGGTTESFYYISNPLKFRKNYQEASNALSN
jgi:uncharacterized membrane protein YdbT with pleckstrin-like domain